MLVSWIFEDVSGGSVFWEMSCFPKCSGLFQMTMYRYVVLLPDVPQGVASTSSSCSKRKWFSYKQHGIPYPPLCRCIMYPRMSQMVADAYMCLQCRDTPTSQMFQLPEQPLNLAPLLQTPGYWGSDLIKIPTPRCTAWKDNMKFCPNFFWTQIITTTVWFNIYYYYQQFV